MYKFKYLFLIGFIFLLNSCKEQEIIFGPEPVIEMIGIPAENISVDPGINFLISAKITSEDELTGIYYFIQRKDQNGNTQESPYEFKFENAHEVEFSVDLYAEEKLVGLKLIAQTKNNKTIKNIAVSVNSFVKFSIQNGEQIITLPGMETSVSGSVSPSSGILNASYQLINENGSSTTEEFEILPDGTFNFSFTPDENTRSLRLSAEIAEGLGVASFPVITTVYVEKGIFINHYYNIKLTTDLSKTPYFSPVIAPYALTFEQAKSNQENIEFFFINMVNVEEKWAGLGLCVFANNAVASTVGGYEYVEGMTYPSGTDSKRRFVYNQLMGNWPVHFDNLTDTQEAVNLLTTESLDWTSNGILRFRDARHGEYFGFKTQKGLKGLAKIVRTEGTGNDAVIYLEIKCQN